jgi:hypothetical protein
MFPANVNNAGIVEGASSRPVRKIVVLGGWRRIGVVAHSRDNLHPLVSLSQAAGLYLPSLSMV